MSARNNGSVEEVRRWIEAAIASGEHPAGSRLPSERTLAESLGVDRRTVARAIALLADAGRLQVDGRFRVVRSLADPNTLAVGLCLDNSVTDRDARNAVGTGRLLIARGLMMRLAEERPPRTMLWCEGLSVDPYDNVPSPEVLWEKGIGALALWPTLPTDDPTIDRLRELREAMPLVLLDRRLPGFEADFVGFDDEEAGRQIARHALELGHRTLAFYGWAAPETVHRRLRGVETVMADAGSPLSSGRTVLVRDDVGLGFEPLLQGAERPTAIVCANDFAAIALLSWLRERGISVPGEIAVLAIGNSFESVHEPLGLTTVAFSHEQAGREAADLLLARLNRSLDPQRVVERRVPGQLVVRRSCGAPSVTASQHSVVQP